MTVRLKQTNWNAKKSSDANKPHLYELFTLRYKLRISAHHLLPACCSRERSCRACVSLFCTQPCTYPASTRSVKNQEVWRRKSMHVTCLSIKACQLRVTRYMCNHTHTHTQTHKHTNTHINTQTHTHTHKYIHTDWEIKYCLTVDVRSDTHTHTHTHTYTYTQTER